MVNTEHEKVSRVGVEMSVEYDLGRSNRWLSGTETVIDGSRGVGSKGSGCFGAVR